MFFKNKFFICFVASFLSFGLFINCLFISVHAADTVDKDLVIDSLPVDIDMSVSRDERILHCTYNGYTTDIDLDASFGYVGDSA